MGLIAYHHALNMKNLSIANNQCLLAIKNYKNRSFLAKAVVFNERGKWRLGAQRLAVCSAMAINNQASGQVQVVQNYATAFDDDAAS